jgi:hypothetical protein
MGKRASANMIAASVTSAVIKSSNLVSITTKDPHQLYEGATVHFRDCVATSNAAVSPGIPAFTGGVVYRIDSPNAVTVKTSSTFAEVTGKFPYSFTATGTIISANGALNQIHLVSAQPEYPKRPSYFNYITPELTATPSGNKVLLSWDAAGLSIPKATISLTETYSGTTAIISTDSVKTNFLWPPVGSPDLTAGVTYTYTLSANNIVAAKKVSAQATKLFINAPEVTAVPTPNTEDSVTISWVRPFSTASITNYRIERTRTGTWEVLNTNVSANLTSFVDNTVSWESGPYTYRVRAEAQFTEALGGTVIGGWTTTVSVTPYGINPVSSVTVSTVAATPNRLLVSWSAASGNPPVSEYVIQRASSSNNTTWSAWEPITLSPLTATSYTDPSASSAIFYKYRVAVKNSQLTSAFIESNSLRAFFLNDPLAAPTVTRQATTNYNLVISGSYTANPAITSYSIQRSENAGSTWSTVTASTPSLPYTDTTTLQGKTYTYRIKATNGQLTTANWSAGSIGVLTYDAPSAPTSVSASVPSGTINILLTWPAAVVNSSGTPVLDYKIERATTANFTTGLTTLSTTTTSVSFTDTTAVTNTLYYYRVSARNSIGYSGFASTSITSAKITSTITLTGPASTYFSDAQTFTATVSPAVAGRTVTFFRDGISVGTATTVLNAAQTIATASINYTTAAVVSELSWTASVASTSVYTDDDSPAVKASVVAMPLTVTIDNSRSGTSVTLSATTKDRNGTTISGTTRTYQRRYYGQTWENTTTTFDISESYAVRVTASKTNYVTTTSAVDTKYVSQTVSTSEDNASASRTYSGNGNLRVETAYPTRDTTRLYHGNWTSGSQGDQKSAIWFNAMPWGRINNAHAVSNISLRLERGPDSGNSTNTIFMIGTHTDGTVRDKWGDIAGKVSGRTSVTLDRSESKTVSLNGLNIDTTTLRGIVIGPAPLDSGGSPSNEAKYYGWLHGNTNASNQPDLSITYQADPHK